MNLDSISNTSECEDPNRDSTITNVIFNDEVTLRNDGTAHWRSSAVAAVSSQCLPLSVERELTFEEVNLEKHSGARKICLSSFVNDNTGTGNLKLKKEFLCDRETKKEGLPRDLVQFLMHSLISDK